MVQPNAAKLIGPLSESLSNTIQKAFGAKWNGENWLIPEHLVPYLEGSFKTMGFDVRLEYVYDTLFDDQANQEYEAMPHEDFIKLDIPPVSWAVENLLTNGSINMIFSAPGIGKSRFCEELLFNAAMGRRFLKYYCPKPLRCVHIHGEMLNSEIKDRLTDLHERYTVHPQPKMFSILSFQLVEKSGLPYIDLYNPQHQMMLNRIIAENDLIVLDNLLTLTGDGEGDSFANKADSWTKIVPWLKGWASKGKTILIVHHTNKINQSAGTSRMDVELGTKIHLEAYTGKIQDYLVAFEIHIEKGRNLVGKQKIPLVCYLHETVTDDGLKTIWEYQTKEPKEKK